MKQMDYYEIEHIVVSIVAACEVQGDTCAPEWICEEMSSSIDLTRVRSVPPHPSLHTILCVVVNVVVVESLSHKISQISAAKTICDTLKEHVFNTGTI